MDKLINILVRTCNRPNYYKALQTNIYSQMYKTIRVLVAYDDKKDSSYFNNWEHFFMKRHDKNVGTFPYNLYENELMAHIKDGWVMFLDDDDQFMDETSLQTIVNRVTSDDNLLLWRVRIHNRVVPEDHNWKKLPVTRCHITGQGFLFHSKYIPFAKWDANKGSDFRVINRLTQTIPNITWIDEVLTGIQQKKNGKRVQGFGRRTDK